MSEMVERLKAVLETNLDLTGHTDDGIRRTACKLIEAMREPTGGMAHAGAGCVMIYQAMIDSALGGFVLTRAEEPQGFRINGWDLT